ncbi:MAG: tRNA lysidine(34) synthetase TilS [Fluviibacter sp.]
MTADTDLIITHLRAALGDACLPNRTICIALSGGMDSMVLLHALVLLQKETPFSLFALHVNHGISPNAAHWAEFCQQRCTDLGVPCEVATLPPLTAAGTGLERAAREGRYALFAAANADVLCMAHHQNDRAETLLLNLCRGAGLQGLAAMPGSRFLNGKRLIRPFIDLPRSELLAWAKSQNLRWIEDESNQNMHYRRNYMRHVVLPAIREQFPGVTAVLARTAAQMQEQSKLLARLADVDAQTCQDEAGHLLASKLALLPAEARLNVLKHRLNGLGVHIPAARRLEALAEQLVNARADAAVFVRFGKTGCHVWRDKLWLDDGMALDLPEANGLQVGEMTWPDGQLIVEPVTEPIDAQALVVRAVGQGQRFQPAGRCRGVLSELLREQGVPAWVRPRLPSLWVRGELVWVAGMGWSEDAGINNRVPLTWIPQAERVL